MNEFLALSISGLVAGALYALMASGLVLSYASSGVLNFAQGSIGFVCAVVFFELNTGLDWPPWLAGVASILVVGPMLGYVLHRVMFSRLAHAGETAQIVATIGLLVALPALTLWVVQLLTDGLDTDLPDPVDEISPPGLGPTPKRFWTPFLGISVDSNQLVTFAAAAICAVGLWLLLSRSTIGLQMRATSDRRELASLRGVNPDRSSAIAWMLSCGLAGLVGVLAAPIYGLNAGSYTLLLFLSATAAVFGRLRSIPITFLAGLLLGVVQNLVGGYASFAESIPGFSNAVPVVLLLVGLLVFNRERGRIAGTVSEDAPPPDYLGDMPKWRRALPWLVAVVALLFYILFVASSFWAGIIAQGLALSVVFLSFTIVTGLGGMVSLAQATFVTMAAMTTGLLYGHGIPLGLAAVIGISAAALVGALFALPALRLGGRVLALATLALALLGESVIFQIPAFNNHGLGWEFPLVAVGPFELSDPKVMSIFLLAIAGLVALLIRNLERSSSGRAILAVRAGPAAAATSGISSTKTKLLLFVLSASIAGLGGVLYGIYQGRISNTDFPAIAGFAWLAVVVVFGVRRPGAAIVAGLVTALMPQLFIEYLTTSAYIPAILFGLGGIGLAQQPDGAFTQMAEKRYQKRRARLERAEIARVVAEEHASATASTHASPVVTVDRPQEATTVGLDSKSALMVMSGLDAAYGEVPVLRGVNLSIGYGSVVALLGANGAGKSTICRVASGQMVPTTGNVTLADEDVTGWSSHRIARRGVFTAPEARGIFPGLTVEENLSISVRRREDRERLYERFPRLADRRRLPSGVLSGGEQQILALAPMLVQPPTLAIADEPSLGLAPRIVDEVLGLFAELRDNGVALLLAEEKATHVMEIADYVAFVRTGEIVWAGPRADVDTEMLADTYLGLPTQSPGRAITP